MASSFTGGHKAIFPGDEELVIAHDPLPDASEVACDPKRYDELHARLVFVETREADKYAGYYLVVDLETIQEDCELVKDPETRTVPAATPEA